MSDMEYNKRLIVDTLRRREMDSHAIAAMFDVSVSMAYKYIKALRAEKRIHVKGFVANPSGRPQTIYAAGPGVDAVYPAKSVRKPRQPDRRAARLESIIVLIAAKAMTARELGEAIHMTPSRTRGYVSQLRKEGRAYIAGWQHPGHRGDLAPRYKLGSKPDTPKPRESRAERYRKEVSDPDRHARILAKKRNSDRIAKLTANRASPFAALGI